MPMNLGERIERVYQETTGSESALGARKWFAEKAGRHYTTVYRWVSGKVDPDPLALRLLEELERDAGVSTNGKGA